MVCSCWFDYKQQVRTKYILFAGACAKTMKGSRQLDTLLDLSVGAVRGLISAAKTDGRRSSGSFQ